MPISNSNSINDYSDSNNILSVHSSELSISDPNNYLVSETNRFHEIYTISKSRITKPNPKYGVIAKLVYAKLPTSFSQAKTNKIGGKL